MPAVDPVILELIARNDRYMAELRKTTRTADQQLGLQQRKVKKLEDQFRSSSGQIGTTLKRLAGVFAGVFSARQLVGLVDSFTRLQNNLKVAGLEGESLARVQQNLLDISQRYGVELESLSSVFLKASLVQQDLGASTADIIRLNEITAAALKVTGTSAAQAQGALLQLGQALGSGVVRAEEFNSILEGALPLAQAAARGIDGFGGSVAKLRKAIADGQITSQQFFQGVLKGGVQTLADAEKATLTLAGGVTALTSALTVYFGEADKANGVSAALGAALGKLAANLDTIIPALATIATFLGVRYVAGAVLASGATRALIAHLAIATTSLAGTALAARSAGAALLAAFGGPVGVALLAISAGLYLVYQRTGEVDSATGRYADGLAASNTITDKARELAEKLADARGKERQATLEALRVEKAKAQQALITARNDITAARAALARARAIGAAQDAASGGYGGAAGVAGAAVMQNTGRRGVSQAQANFNAAEQAAKNIEAGLQDISKIISGSSGGVAIPSAGKAAKATKGRAATGPSIEEIERRFLDELDANRSRVAAAESSMARNADERADLELRQLESARRQTLRSLEADEDYSEAQKERVRLQVETVAYVEREAIEFARRAQIEREATDLADEAYRAQDDALRLQYDLADTQDERRRITLAALDLEERYREALLESVIASETMADADKERARLALEALRATAGMRRDAVIRSQQGPLGRYADSLADPRTRVEEAVTRRLEEIDDGIADAISKKLGVKDPLIRDLIGLFIEQTLIRPIVDSLRNAQGAGGGVGGLLAGIGAAVGAIFGGGGPTNLLPAGYRASGGPVSAGSPYMVGERGPELMVPRSPGFVVPNHKLGMAGGGGISVVRLELSGDIDARIQRVSGPVAIEVVRASAPAIIDASAGETSRRMSRPRM